jgi:hypothetical protein
MTRATLALAALVAAPLAARAQALVPIGTTATGNPVLLESKSVRRAGDTVTATVRVKFGKPVRTPQGEVRSSRTIARWHCGTRQVAVRENWYFVDEAGRTVSSHRTVGIPGFATTIGGSMTAVALDHLCAVTR